MKIALVSFDFGDYFIPLAGWLAEVTDTQVLLLLTHQQAEPYLHLVSKSVELRVFKKPRLRQPIRQVRMVARLVRQIRKFKPDVIHLQLGHLWFNWAPPLLGNCPLVLTVHDSVIHTGDSDSSKTPQWIRDRACYRAHQLIVHAPQVRDSVLQRLDIPSNTVHVIPHIRIGEDTALSMPFVEEPLVLFFGRIWDYKGLEYLIRAEPLITSSVPQAKIVIAGKGQDFDRYRRLMVNPERFIVYNDYISNEKRAELFQRASVVVLPYIEASQSGVIPLAHSFGKPVVATSVGGLPAQIEDGKSGYLVPPRDSNALAEAVIHLLQNKEHRERLGENGRRKINIEASPEVIARKTRMVYQLAIDAGCPLVNSEKAAVRKVGVWG